MSRPRILALAGAIVIVLAGVAVGATIARRDSPLDDDVRADLVAAGRADPDVALATLTDLAADPDEWADVVSRGGADLAIALDRAQGAIGVADDPAALVTPFVAPLLGGQAVDDLAIDALTRATWPYLADPDGPLAGAVIELTGDDEPAQARLAQAIVLAHAYRISTDRDPLTIADWSTAVRTALVSNDPDWQTKYPALADLRADIADLPTALAYDIAILWTPGPTPAADPARTVLRTSADRVRDLPPPAPLADDDPEAGGPTSGGTVLVVAALVAVDDADDPDTTDALLDLISDVAGRDIQYGADVQPQPGDDEKHIFTGIANTVLDGDHPPLDQLYEDVIGPLSR